MFLGKIVSSPPHLIFPTQTFFRKRCFVPFPSHHYSGRVPDVMVEGAYVCLNEEKQQSAVNLPNNMRDSDKMVKKMSDSRIYLPH